MATSIPPENNELLDQAAVSWAVASGQLLVQGGKVLPDYGAGFVWGRAEYEAVIQHTSGLASSGITSNQRMTWGQMLAYRDLTPPADPVPTGFSGYHDQAWCPTPRVVLSWASPFNLPTVLEWRQGAGPYTQIATIAAGTTSYNHSGGGSTGPGEGSNQYRLSYYGYTTYVTTSVFVACMA